MTEIVKDKCKEAKIILNSLYILINYFIVNYSSVNQNYFLNCTLFNINLRLSHSFNKECINKHNLISLIEKCSFIDVCIHEIKTIKSHTNEIYSLITLLDGRIASFSYDSLIKLFNSSTYECEMTITGHTLGINGIIQLEDGTILSCSEDESIKFWTLTQSSYKCIHTIESAHLNSVYAITSLSHNRFASSEIDGLYQNMVY